MLILTRKEGETIFFGDSIRVTLAEIKGQQVRKRRMFEIVREELVSPVRTRQRLSALKR